MQTFYTLAYANGEGKLPTIDGSAPLFDTPEDAETHRKATMRRSVLDWMIVTVLIPQPEADHATV